MTRSMKLMLIASTALALSACNKAKPIEQTQAGEIETIDDTTLETNMADMPMADDPVDNNSEMLNDQQLDESSDAMMTQQAQDEEDERMIEYVNPNAANDLYVLRDKASGCEFIEVKENDATVVIARPDGRGGQRGCRSGTDFKAAEAS